MLSPETFLRLFYLGSTAALAYPKAIMGRDIHRLSGAHSALLLFLPTVPREQ
jgi:hypothetical protein